MTIVQLHPQGQPTSWHEQLKAASTEADVVAIARDYLATVTPDEIKWLPEHLRPHRLVDANDITTYAFELVRFDCGDHDGMQRLVHRLAHFFSSASIRLSEIMVREHRDQANDDDQQRSA